MVRTLTLSILLFSSTLGMAQKEKDSVPSNYFGIQLGSLGIGGQYSHNIHPRWNIRLSASYIQLSMDKEKVTSTYRQDIEYNARLGGIALLADYSLRKTNGNFKLSTGVIYQFNKVSQNSQFTYIGDESSQLDLGTLNLTFTTFPVNPYVGLVLGNFQTKKRLFFTFEMGTTFHGSPRVEFTGTGIVRHTADQGEIVEKNVHNYSWYPYGNFQLNYKLK